MKELQPPVVVGSYPTRPGRTGNDDAVPWYSDYQNVARVARYMADNCDSADEVAYMVEKPWKYTDRFEWMLSADGPDGELR